MDFVWVEFEGFRTELLLEPGGRIAGEYVSALCGDDIDLLRAADAEYRIGADGSFEGLLANVVYTPVPREPLCGLIAALERKEQTVHRPFVAFVPSAAQHSPTRKPSSHFLSLQRSPSPDCSKPEGAVEEKSAAEDSPIKSAPMSGRNSVDAAALLQEKENVFELPSVDESNAEVKKGMDYMRDLEAKNREKAEKKDKVALEWFQKGPMWRKAKDGATKAIGSSAAMMEMNSVPNCMFCLKKFSAFAKKCNCQKCGSLLCMDCTPHRAEEAGIFSKKNGRLCVRCFVLMEYCKACKKDFYVDETGKTIIVNIAEEEKVVKAEVKESKGVDAEVLRDDDTLPQDDRERRRVKCIKEIIITERIYIEDLNVLINCFMFPLRYGEKVKDKQAVEKLFSNIEIIPAMHKEIYDKLVEDNVMQTGVGIVEPYTKLISLTNIYRIYCANHDDVFDTLEGLKKDPEFAKVLRKCKEDPKVKEPIDTYLIKPVQRICKYPLLFKELMSLTPETHPDYEALEALNSDISTLVSVVNEGKRESEQRKRMLELVKIIDGDLGDEGLVTPTRVFKAEGDVMSTKPKEQKVHVLVFNDLVLITNTGKKKMTVKGYIPMKECEATFMDSKLTRVSRVCISEASKNCEFFLQLIEPYEEVNVMSVFNECYQKYKSEQGAGYIPKIDRIGMRTSMLFPKVGSPLSHSSSPRAVERAPTSTRSASMCELTDSPQHPLAKPVFPPSQAPEQSSAPPAPVSVPVPITAATPPASVSPSPKTTVAWRLSGRQSECSTPLGSSPGSVPFQPRLSGQLFRPTHSASELPTFQSTPKSLQTGGALEPVPPLPPPQATPPMPAQDSPRVQPGRPNSVAAPQQSIPVRPPVTTSRPLQRMSGGYAIPPMPQKPTTVPSKPSMPPPTMPQNTSPPTSLTPPQCQRAATQGNLYARPPIGTQGGLTRSRSDEGLNEKAAEAPAAQQRPVNPTLGRGAGAPPRGRGAPPRGRAIPPGVRPPTAGVPGRGVPSQNARKSMPPPTAPPGMSQ